MSQAPFLAKKLNHESNPFKNDVFIKFKCFCQKKKKKKKKKKGGGGIISAVTCVYFCVLQYS